jgi:hypothetical protein
MSDRMVAVANIVSRSEALVVASMFDAAGIIVHVGGEHHASVEIISTALGGYRVTVPEWQYADASGILAETFADGKHSFSIGLQMAVIRLILAWFGSLLFVGTFICVFTRTAPPTEWLFLSFSVISLPVNPQGASEYYLATPTNAAD